jgi:hypothetical protein
VSRSQEEKGDRQGRPTSVNPHVLSSKLKERGDVLEVEEEGIVLPVFRVVAELDTALDVFLNKSQRLGKRLLHGQWWTLRDQVIPTSTCFKKVRSIAVPTMYVTSRRKSTCPPSLHWWKAKRMLGESSVIPSPCVFTTHTLEFARRGGLGNGTLG